MQLIEKLIFSAAGDLPGQFQSHLLVFALNIDSDFILILSFLKCFYFFFVPISVKPAFVKLGFLCSK